MKPFKVLLTFSFITLLTSTCSGPTSPITPAPDQPTFLYFYTDG